MKTMTLTKKTTMLLALAAMAGACSDDADGSRAEGTGTAVFTTFGEDYIEKEIPAADVEDGWTVKYDRFLVVLHDLAVAEGPTAAPAARMTESKIFDMHAPGDKPVATFANLPGKPYPHVSYRIAPPTAASVPSEGATEGDKQQLLQGGFSVYVAGSIQKGAVTKTFRWGFVTDTLYDRCEGELAGKRTEGIVVTNGGTDVVQLTIHGDHLFYDDLQAADAKLRGDNVALADANDDGDVTLEELAAVSLTRIPQERGAYGTGSAAGVHDLRAFVEALSRTLGHFRGEGECFARAR